MTPPPDLERLELFAWLDAILTELLATDPQDVEKVEGLNGLAISCNMLITGDWLRPEQFRKFRGELQEFVEDAGLASIH